MYLKYGSFSLFSLLFLAISTPAQNANKNNLTETFSKADISKIQTKTFTARVSSAPNSKSITVQIPNQKIINNNNNTNNNNTNNNNTNNNAPRRNNTSSGNQAQNRQRQIAQAQVKQIQMLKSMKVAIDWVEIEVPVKEVTKIRAKAPLESFDEKGSIKKYTAEELKTLKGTNPNLPGYEVKLDEITPGMVVEITLGKSAGNKDEKKDDPKSYAALIMVIGKDSTFKPPADNSKTKKK